MPQERKEEKVVEQTVPILAAAAMQNAAGGNEALNAVLMEFLQDYMEKRRKEKSQMLRRAESAVQAAKEEAATRKAREGNCSHRKQDGKTRLAGQRLSNGQLSLVCLFCHKNFFDPPLEGQEMIPRDLLPPADEIGG